MNSDFKALIVEEYEENKFRRFIGTRKIEDLPQGDVLIRVHYSSLNYKDALSARGHKGISRKYPHTPGIDASGIVEESSDDRFQKGDKVIVTGYDLGMNTSGGFSEYIRVPSDWVVFLPDTLSLKEAMYYGTAGFTAGVCLFELENHNIFPNRGKVLVSGATGGVGSIAVAILNELGYLTIASTGKPENIDMLKNLGASEVINRNELQDTSTRPLLSGRWVGAIDTVGGNTLSTIMRSTTQRGCVCVLGNVESDSLGITVYPFLLRGITLTGIDSASRPMDEREYIWDKLSSEWNVINKISKYIKEIKLEQLSDEIDIILNGGQSGRVIVNLLD